MRFAAPPNPIPSDAATAVTFVPPARWLPVLQRYDLSAPFVIHHGPDDPARNTRRLIEAWALTDKNVRQKMQLAVIGISAASSEALVNIVNRLGLAQSVRLYSRLADPSDLSALLSAADISALPTTGGNATSPIVDAWAARAAVLTSDHPTMAAFIGDAGVTVDPTDPGAIARGINRLVRDSRFRRDLVERGRQRFAQDLTPAAARRRNSWPGPACTLPSAWAAREPPVALPASSSAAAGAGCPSQ